MSSLDEKLFPELLLFEPGRERRRMMRRVFRNTRTVAAFGLAVVIFVYGVDGPLRSYLGRLGLPHWAVTVIAALCAGGMAYAAIWVIVISLPKSVTSKAKAGWSVTMEIARIKGEWGILGIGNVYP